MSEADRGDLIARLCLIPRRGLLAEFRDGDSFRLGWTNWWKREWNWTNADSERVLSSKHTVWGRAERVRIEPAGFAERKIAALAILEVAAALLQPPWF